LSGASFCGTCFMQTRIFKRMTPRPYGSGDLQENR
jgi:hypothetical protein